MALEQAAEKDTVCYERVTLRRVRLQAGSDVMTTCRTWVAVKTLRTRPCDSG